MDFQQQYIEKMNSIAEGITRKAYQNMDGSLNEFIAFLHRMKDEGHQIIVALDQMQRTPTLLLHPKTLNLKYYEGAEILLIAYFDIIIHLQFAFEMYQIDIKYDNPNAICKFQNFVERMPYGTISINGTYYDISTSFDIPKKPIMATGKGSKSKNTKRISKWEESIEGWKQSISMPQKVRDIYSLVGKITYLLDSNRKSGELIIASATEYTNFINKDLSILTNLKSTLRKFDLRNREEILSLISLKGRIPKECAYILERL